MADRTHTLLPLFLMMNSVIMMITASHTGGSLSPQEEMDIILAVHRGYLPGPKGLYSGQAGNSFVIDTPYGALIQTNGKESNYYCLYDRIRREQQ